MKDFDATSLFPSAMWDKISLYPKKETGLTFKPHKIDSCKEAFNIRTSNQNSNESAILRKKCYNPPDLIFQHLPVRAKFRNIEINRMRIGYIFDILTSADNQEIVIIVGKVIEIHEGVIY